MLFLKSFFYVIAVLVLFGCGSSSVNINDGTFETYKAPNLSGNMRPMNKGYNGNISLSASYGNNERIRLYGVENDPPDESSPNYTSGLTHTEARISYRFIETTAGANFALNYKTTYFFWGGNAGVNPFPYLASTVGINTQTFEFGVNLLSGITRNKMSYTVTRGGSETSVYSVNNAVDWHLSLGAGAYGSYFLSDFALNYAFMLTSPWVTHTLQDASETINITFPYFLQQDLGVAYNLQNVYFRLGVTLINGEYLGGRSFSTNAKLGYNF
jgi:hypothetical protein